MGEFLTTFPNLVASEGGGHEGTSYWGYLFYVVLTLIVLFALIGQARKGFGQRVFKNPLTQASEQLYLFIENMCISTIGPHGRKYIPMIGTFWLVIFVGNALSLFFASAPTAELSFNLGMALIAIAYVQYEGIRANGFFGHISHFAGPRLGLVMGILVTPLIFAIEIVSELMKNVSLSLRLFGNIHGGHEAVEAMNQLGVHPWGIHWFNFPVGGLLLLIKLLTVIVQALIFTLLTCVYLSLVTHHSDDHGNEHEESGTLAPAH